MDQLREKMAAVNNSNKENVAADAKEELLGKILNSDRAKHDRSINRIAFEYFWMKNSEQTPSGVRAFPTVVQAKFFKKAVEEELGKLKPEERQNFIEELNKYVEAIENAQESGVGKTTSNNPFDKIHEQLKKDGAGQPKGSGDGQMGEE